MSVVSGADAEHNYSENDYNIFKSSKSSSPISSEIEILKNELKKKQELLDRYASNDADFEEVHKRLRNEISKYTQAELTIDNLTKKLKQSQVKNEQMKNNVQEYKKIYEKKLAEAKSQYITDLQNMEKQYDSKLQQLEMQMVDVNNLPTIQKFISSVSDCMHKDFSSLDDVFNYIMKVGSDIDNIVDEIKKECRTEVNDLLEELKKVKSKNEIISQANKELFDENRELQKISRQLKYQCKRISHAKKKIIEDSTREVSTAHMNLKQCNNRIINLENNIAKLKKNKRELEDRLYKLNEENNVQCLQIKDLLKQNAEDASTRAEQGRKDASTFSRQVDVLREELNKVMGEKNKVETDFKLFTDKAKGALDQRAILKDEIQTKNHRIKELEDRILSVTNDLHRTELEKSTLLEDIAYLREKVEVMNMDSPKANPKTYDSFLNMIESLKNEIALATKNRNDIAIDALKLCQSIKAAEDVLSNKKIDYSDFIIKFIFPVLNVEERLKAEKLLYDENLTSVGKSNAIVQLLVDQKPHSQPVDKYIHNYVSKLRNYTRDEDAIMFLSTWLKKLNEDSKSSTDLDIVSTVRLIAKEGLAAKESIDLLTFVTSLCIQQDEEIKRMKTEIPSHQEMIQMRRDMQDMEEKLHEAEQKSFEYKRVIDSLRDELARGKSLPDSERVKQMQDDIGTLVLALKKTNRRCKRLQEELQMERDKVKLHDHSEGAAMMRELTVQLQRRENKIRDLETKLRLEEKRHIEELRLAEESKKRKHHS